MRLTIRLLGVEVLHLTTDAPADPADPDGPYRGDSTSFPVGFSRSPTAEPEHVAPEHVEF